MLLVLHWDTMELVGKARSLFDRPTERPDRRHLVGRLVRR